VLNHHTHFCKANGDVEPNQYSSQGPLNVGRVPTNGPKVPSFLIFSRVHALPWPRSVIYAMMYHPIRVNVSFLDIFKHGYTMWISGNRILNMGIPCETPEIVTTFHTVTTFQHEYAWDYHFFTVELLVCVVFDVRRYRHYYAWFMVLVQLLSLSIFQICNNIFSRYKIYVVSRRERWIWV